MADDNVLYSIGIVERDTGIGRDTLRVWERRYGHPRPERNAKGERAYTGEQLHYLQRIRRLMDQGLRPGKLLPLSEEALGELEGSLYATIPQELDETVHALLKAIRSSDTNEVEEILRHRYEQEGMKDFILNTVAPIVKAVGDAWASGVIQIFQEHFLSEHLIRFLNKEIASFDKKSDEAKVLLATLPGEEHTLGLLMISGLLGCSGKPVINLGAEVPMGQIGWAVEQFHVEIVGITFSAAYPYNQIRSHLLELREMLPDHVQLWVGGEGVHRLRKLPKSIKKFTSLEGILL